MKVNGSFDKTGDGDKPVAAAEEHHLEQKINQEERDENKRFKSASDWEFDIEKLRGIVTDQ